MIRKVKRTEEFEITLQIKADGFIRPPRDAQRNWILNRALKEFGDDLEAMNKLSGTFVPGDDSGDSTYLANEKLSNDEIMEDWQIPVMKAMALQVTESHGDVLEIGFGRGVASDFIQEFGVRSHTVVECNASVIGRFEQWKNSRPDQDIRLIQGKWQDTENQFGQYDGVFFHTYPLNEEEFIKYVFRSTTFAEHFFDTASAHLRPGGIFSYLTNEIDSLSRGHQRELLKRFSSFKAQVLTGLEVPHNTRDKQWARQIVIVAAEK